MFFLEVDILPLFLLKAGLLGDLIVFNIEVSGTAIVLKSLINPIKIGKA